jgi:hypothetical protein
MPILEGDIKLLKSAVMADTEDGGGAMTGVEVIDGQSNNLFADTSEMDRASGRFNARKVFGVAHSDDADTFMGAHAVITAPPADPLVHCTLMQTPGWADTRTAAREIIERYLVKGSRISPRLMDTHYTGSLQLRLVSAAADADFPRAGDALALVAPDGHEQYVRVTKISFTTQTFYVEENGGVVQFTGTIGTVDLGQRLDYDFPGPPVSRIAPNPDSAYCRIYNTTLAGGARFYGIKPLMASAALGDISVIADGIFTPLVPAATIETPIIDQYPLAGRSALAMTAYAPVSINGTGAVGLGVTLTLPAPIEPKSLSIAAGSASFADSGTGALLQGATAVGSIDYARGRVVFAESSPSYGTTAITATFKPATRAQAPGFSAEYKITINNQGLAFVNAFEPVPVPGSLEFEYMAQGRWYSLVDNMAGKLAGADAAYGVGTLSYATGSMAVTLGALPDVGSSLITRWGDASSAKAVAGTMPAKLSAMLSLPGALANGVVATWSHGASNYTASTNASGVLSGDATGTMTGGELAFAPGVFPDGAISLTYKTAAVVDAAFTQTSDHVFQAAGALPVKPGTIRGMVFFGTDLTGFSDAGGAIRAYRYNTLLEIGSIEYATGELTFYETASAVSYTDEIITAPGGWQIGMRYGVYTATPTGITISGAYGLSYGHGTETTHTTSITPSVWLARIETNGRETLLLDSALLTVGGDVYSSAAGVLRKGWSLHTGAPAVVSAGALTSSGELQVTSLPSNKINTLVWRNLAQDLATAKVDKGVFRTASSPLKVGVMQLQAGDDVGSGSEAGQITGAFGGDVDYQRGIVRWEHPVLIDPASLSYNAVFLQYLPIDGDRLGLETARLPLDGRVPIYRAGELQIVHNTQTFTLPNPLVKGTMYSVGRERLAAMKVKTLTDQTVDTTLYTAGLDAGTIVVPVGADLTGLVQPFAVEHRIEDMVECSVADISGKLTFTRALTHTYPAGSSYVSSVLEIGDVFARAYGGFAQTTWTGQWSDEPQGDQPLADYNDVISPVTVTGRGAIKERWVFIFTTSSDFRIIGEHVGVIGTGSINAVCAPVNPATGAPYFTVDPLGWGIGWAAGNVYRRNTDACGAPFWVARTVLQGPASVQDDRFTLAFRGDVNRP